MNLHGLTRRLNALRRRFSSSGNVILTGAGVERLPGNSVRPHRIVGRGLCLYRCEQFDNVPKSKRRAALELKIPVWSPFQHTGHHCVWSGSSAMVWLWDADAVSGDDFPAAVPEGASRVVPETVFLPRKARGLHLQACRAGFELQLWRDDVLQDSVWYGARPTEEEVERFASRSGATGGGVLGEGPPALSPEPWASMLGPAEWLAGNERAVVTTCLAALLLAAVWFEARIWHVRFEAGAVGKELEAMEAELGPLLAERTEFLRLRRIDEGLAAILTHPSQALLMGLVDRAVPSDQATFYRWQYRQGELQVTIEDPALDPIAYVEQFQRVPRFEQVKAELALGQNRLEVTLQVGT